MSIAVTFAEQGTGIVTLPDGTWALDGQATQSARFHDFAAALAAVETHFADHPGHEAWMGSSKTRHRVTLQSQGTFSDWMGEYQRSGSLGEVRPGMSFGDLIRTLGSPQQCSVLRSRSPLAVIFRYEPGDVDFHFGSQGLLWLVQEDALGTGRTILGSR